MSLPAIIELHGDAAAEKRARFVAAYLAVIAGTFVSHHDVPRAQAAEEVCAGALDYLLSVLAGRTDGPEQAAYIAGELVTRIHQVQQKEEIHA